MFDRETTLALWLNYGTKHGTVLFQKVSVAFNELEEAFEAAAKGEREAFAAFPPELSARLIAAAAPGFMERYTGWLSRHKIGVVTLFDPEYPEALRFITHPPSLLFVRGHLKTDIALPIGVIGSRACSDYGKAMARHLGRQLAESGATVISGLAAGIDSYATLGALDCQNSEYPTIGVLGCGIDMVYPRGNETLFDAVEERGAVISEFLPKTPPLPYHFPVRNRIVAGLSRGIVVVEAGEKSGASITAGIALEQGRDVFAVPGRVTDIKSMGTNRMIARGEAKPVMCAGDILCEYDAGFWGDDTGGRGKIAFSSLDKNERAVYQALLSGEKNVDFLQEITKISVAELNSVLTAMEFAGIIRQSAGRLYACDNLQTSVNMDE